MVYQGLEIEVGLVYLGRFAGLQPEDGYELGDWDCV